MFSKKMLRNAISRPRLLASAVAMAVAGMSGAAQAEDRGAETGGDIPEPLREAIVEAVSENPEVQTEWHNFLATEREQDVERGGFRPRVDMNAYTGYETQNSSDRDRFSRNPHGASITLTQMLWDGLETRGRTDRMGEIKLVRYFAFRESAEETALEALRAFADVQRQRKLVDLAERNFEAHEAIHDRLQEQRETGVGRGADLEQAAGRLALARSNLTTERANLHDVSARYQRVVGQHPDPGEVPLAGTFDEDVLPQGRERALEEALTTSPAMFAARHNVGAAQEQRRVGRSAFHPNLEFQASQSWANDTMDFADSTVSDTSARLVLNFNLYRGGSDRARLGQYTEEFHRSVEEQRTACRNVRQDITVAYNNIEALTDQVEYLRQHRDSSEEVRGAYRQQFEIGERSLLDVLDTENEFFDASRALVNAEYDLEIAKARALATMGDLLEYLDIARSDMPDPEDIGAANGQLSLDDLCPAEPVRVFRQEAELRQQLEGTGVSVTRDGDNIILNMPGNITFGFDRDNVRPEFHDVLHSVSLVLQEYDQTGIEVAGHTDSVGREEYNMDLSQRRAQSVAQVLMQNDIQSVRIHTIGFGPHQPIASNETEQGRAQNRRVELTLFPLTQD